ncbi:MAG TPA: aminoglycoside phosphotransferase family protein [Caldilineaceae bacterium]|nr:aminoglycoside phosphotransferase family protein [Caldilineaceae bacterium]
MLSTNRGTSATSLQRATIHDPIVSDQTMPQLAIALDPLLMQLHFQSLLFGNSGITAAASATDYEVHTCEVVRVKYRAGEKCVISYRLQIQKRRSNRLIEQWLSARLFPTGTAASRYHKALREPLTPPPFGDAVMFLPKLDMVIWAFPNDRKIGGLPALLAAAAHETDQLDALVAGRWGATTIIVAHDYRLIHYVPEHTCTVREQLLLADTTTGQTWPATLFAKAYYNEEGAETFRLMQQLWQRAACRQGHLRIAQPIAYCAVDQVLWQEGLPGHTLLTYALGTPAFDELLAEAAQAVAWLHTADLPCQRQSAQQEWVNLIDQRKQLVIQSRPHLAGAVDTLAVALRCLTPSISGAPMATLHGDLHLQNFLVDDDAAAGKRVALIDLDNLCTGMPWQDLGSFCAGLYYRGLVDHVPQSLIHRSIDGFLQSYATSVPWPLDRGAINWYTAAALLHERAFRSIARMKEGRLALVDDLVRIATDLLLGQL